ncbi:MAG TPA: DUF1801 domain-containing protein [Dehalococcoidia bacterium]|nr:DUF1801 domain-containing protein [Dehalococcoidia bacterium]
MDRITVSPEAILEPFSPEIAELVDRIRLLVRDTVPVLTETGYPGWRAVAFRHPVAGYVCGAFPSDDSVKFLFEQGVHLDDPAAILQGSTKQTRHVVLRPGKPLPSDALTALILEAVAFGEARRASRTSPNRK